MKIVSTSLSLINNHNCFTFNQKLTSWEKKGWFSREEVQLFQWLVVLFTFLLGLIITSEKS